MRKLPPLNALRAFEATARQGTVTKAAAELHVTHGAVSRQLALLEEWMGHPLFIRTPGVQPILTEAGRTYARNLTELLDRVAAASNAVRAHARHRVALTAAPTFTMHWLIPRIAVYQRRCPDCFVDVATSSDPVRLEDGRVDIAIHNRVLEQSDVVVKPFMSDFYTPICHVDLLDCGRPPDETWLGGQTLLSYAPWAESWSLWSDSAGMKRLQGARQQQFEQMYFARQATLEGLGVAIMPLAVVLDEIVQGRLTAPFGLCHARPCRWFVSVRQSRVDDPMLRGFLAWLLEEGIQFEAAARSCIGSQYWNDDCTLCALTGSPEKLT